jgi:deoxycytidylate deaminase
MREPSLEVVWSMIPRAVQVALRSPCAKSRRGVVIFDEHGVIASGCNAQPAPFACDGSDACRAACGKLCVHAEAAALRDAGRFAVRGAHMLHVKAEKGVPVASGPPSCWQCSREILAAGVAKVWLLHDDGVRGYTAVEFHRLTLQHCGLPALGVS